MTNIIDAIAEIGQGALTARAVEPTAGENTGHTHESACLNCGTRLMGSHCHACGQGAHVHRTIGAFFHDLLHGVFHFEGKIWRTLPLLAWQPGRLTREYIDGRRASYVSPIALFLFVVFLTFAVFNALGDFGHFNPKVAADAATGMTTASDSLQDEITRLEKQRTEALVAKTSTADIDRQLTGRRNDLAIVKRVASEIPKDDATPVHGKGQAGAVVASGLNAAWIKAKDNPPLLVYKLQSNAYKYSWLLIPLSVPLVWLLFPFSRRFHLYDHTVFVTYSLSFMLLLIAAVSLAVSFSLPGPIIAVLLLYAPFHMYRQLRGTYTLSRASAVWRTWALIIFSSIAIVLFAAALLALVMS